MFRQKGYEYQILGVKYTKEDRNAFYRAPTTEDKNALEKAKALINDDMGLFSLLTEDVPPTGEKTSEPVGYGITEWRDFFNPRQLVTHYEYWQAFEDVKEEILETYSDKKAESIVTILALTAGKMIDYNSRLSPYKMSKGYPENAFAGKNFTLQWI
jgi:adenine-specific DNA methylase